MSQCVELPAIGSCLMGTFVEDTSNAVVFSLSPTPGCAVLLSEKKTKLHVAAFYVFPLYNRRV